MIGHPNEQNVEMQLFVMSPGVSIVIHVSLYCSNTCDLCMKREFYFEKKNKNIKEKKTAKSYQYRSFKTDPVMSEFHINLYAVWVPSSPLKLI